MPTTTTTPTKEASARTAETVALRSIEVMADGDLDDFIEVVHPDATNREASSEPPATRGTGPEAFLATAHWLRQAYAELRWEIHDVVSDGDLVVVHCTMSGRQVGPFLAYDQAGRVARAFPATGKRFATTQTHWLRVADGKVIEHWANRDDMGTAAQLGWIPPSPAFLLRSELATRKARRAAM